MGNEPKTVNTSVVQNVIKQVLYKADKRDLDSCLKRDGSLNMTGNLQMNNSRIKGLPTTTPQTGDKTTSKDYVLTLINVHFDRSGSLKMTGDLNMDETLMMNLKVELVQSIRTMLIQLFENLILTQVIKQISLIIL